MRNTFKCYTCKKQYEVNRVIWRCDCGGMLDLVKNSLSKDEMVIHKQDSSMWRYHQALPFEGNSILWKGITMGEGFTPVIPLSEEDPKTFLKMDYLNPTLSFKDRGAAVLITKAKELGVSHLIADSSGNAGTSIAAYARRAGISCDIFVSSAISSKKLTQIKSHNAKIHLIDGSREDVANKAKEAVEESHAFYASHVYNPYFYEGTKTYIYEIWEQFKTMPDALIIPVGNGTLLLGIYYGLCELKAADKIKKMPKIVAIQAHNCAPLKEAFDQDLQIAPHVENKGTLAEGIAISAPARSEQILAALRLLQAEIITVTESEIRSARKDLAMKGFFVEYTSAVNYAGYLAYDKVRNESFVIPLCGAGIKSD